jgi:peptidoglycan-associated lipoprotein
MYIRIPIIASLIFIISSCSVNRLVTDANTSFSKHEYFAASEKYKVAQQKIKDSSKKSSVYFNMAESYQKLGDYAKAATWYKSALRTGYKDSTLELRYADALRGSGKPELALPVYETVRKSDPRNKWAINGAESVNLISKWKKTPELYIVENLKSINSIQHDVVSQIVPDSEKSIILRSSRENPGEKKVNPATGQKFSSFYTATFDTLKKKWSPPLLLSEPATANSPEEEIDINISTNKKLIVFARLVQQPLKPAISQLFCMQKNNEEWSTPEIIQFCTEEADFTHPMLTEDGKTLWFASNKTGGNGGFDIWKSTISSSGTFSEPENAGPEINTPGNEIFPFEKPNIRALAATTSLKPSKSTANGK